jgi:hypothetical protein
MSVRPHAPPSESRLNERLARVLRQKKAPDAVIVGVLSVALLLGLVGLALHVRWVVAIIVMALGLGFALANRRRDRIDVVNQRAEDATDQSDSARRARDTAAPIPWLLEAPASPPAPSDSRTHRLRSRVNSGGRETGFDRPLTIRIRPVVTAGGVVPPRAQRGQFRVGRSDRRVPC